MLLLLLLWLLTWPSQALPASAPTRTVLAMGTTLAVHLGTPAQAEAALAAVARVEGWGSTWRSDTAFAALNRSEGRPTHLPPEALAVLARAQTWSRRTGGAFDPVLGRLVAAWGIRRGGATQGAADLEVARRASGSGHLSLDPRAGSARLANSAQVEEGGFLKGHALDAARVASGAPGGLLDFGGQLLAWGRPVDVEVASPSDRQRPALRLRLSDASLAVSALRERGSHILDPRTGRPAPDWGAVAVLAASALDADCLSTALYVLGPDAGPDWAEAEGLAAAFLSHDGTVAMTTAFRALHPTLLDPETP